MSKLPEVVITGLGAVSPLGVGRDAHWAALEARQSGVDWMPPFAGSDLPFRYAGLIKEFDAKDYVQPRKTIKVMSGEIQAAYASAKLALEEAGLASGGIEPNRLGVVMGSEMTYGEVEDLIDTFRQSSDGNQFVVDRWVESVCRNLFPLWMLKYLPNMAACHISVANNAHGPNNSIVQGAVSPLLAVMEATMVIQRGLADAMVVGGTGCAASVGCLPFRGWEHLSQWKGEPARASRPFDAERSGIVPGEGAAAFVLESQQSAERRGAKIIARVLGFANRFEPLVPGRPAQGTALRASIQASLATAGLKPADIGHVNAHGDSTIHTDRVEAQAIAATLGEVPVTAPKSYFGDLSAGSGAVEMAVSVLALIHGKVPPTLNYDTPDPDCPINVVRGDLLAGTKPTALLLNQSTTGQAAAVVIAAP
jgi:3-oxoacyl-[acyl-carrier-protein] synthase II